MPTLKWNRLIGQERVRSVIGRAFGNGTLGHAYLFCGGRGVGKFAAALDLASALLCRSVGEERPCGECLSCKKIATYSHPDFHVIMPLVLSAEHKATGGGLSEEGWAFAAERAKGRIADPYGGPRYDGPANIPVDWIREANEAIWRGGTEGPFNVALIDGVETMSKESSNALLKTLEEPPPGAVMILLTDSPHAVLRTIVSRCQMTRFPLLPPGVIRAELALRLGAGADVPRLDAAAECGSLGAAIEELEGPLPSYYEPAAALWNSCLRGEWEAAARSVERLSDGGEAASVESRNTIVCLIRLLRSAFLHKYGTPINYISLGASDFITLPETAAPADVERYVRLCEDALSSLTRWNSLMVLANLACALMGMLNGEEQ